jgi:hypothetical protein
MAPTRRRPGSIRKVWLPTLAGFLLATLASCRADGETAAHLIDELTYQSAGQQARDAVMRLGCGKDGEDRAVARSLAKLGLSAIPALQQALDSIESLGDASKFSFNSGWLILAYARIEGPAALPQLQKMIGNPKLDFLQVSLERAVALSLGLTSYVSEFRDPSRYSIAAGRRSLATLSIS